MQAAIMLDQAIAPMTTPTTTAAAALFLSLLKMQVATMTALRQQLHVASTQTAALMQAMLATLVMLVMLVMQAATMLANVACLSLPRVPLQ